MDNSPTGQIDTLKYRFYSPKEVKCLSVRHVTNDLAFDKFTGRGVDYGLHDAMFGPHTEKDVCGHCGLDFINCPGHFGHIELAKPVYNPFLFDVLFKSKLPGIPKPAELDELAGLSDEKLRQMAFRYMSMRSRIPCKLCGSGSWILRHINRQQIVVRPVSAIGNARMKAVKEKEDQEADCSDLLEGYNLEDDPRMISNLTSESKTPIFIDLSADNKLSKLENDYTANLTLIRNELSEGLKQRQSNKEVSLIPETVRIMLKCLWNHDGHLLSILFPMVNAAILSHEFPLDIFFMDSILLSPSLCRWPRYIGSLAYEHPETAIYVRVIRRAQCLQNIVEFIRQRKEQQTTSTEQQSKSKSKSVKSKQNRPSLSDMNDSELIDLCKEEEMRSEGALKLATVMLQASVNGIYDMNMALTPSGLESKTGAGASSNTIRLPGIKQRLEKKEGLFRMHMMGKRVNFACRSVISPDPNISVTEVGVPLFFASRLTSPTPVTTFNLTELRELVMNGPHIYPGARSVQFPDGRLIVLPGANAPQAKKRREMLARRLAPIYPGTNSMPIVVNRHLLAGDMLVMNRQPTLHRPSMQAHRVRVIDCKGAKTLRMHYSNCKAYNADFDGDEMNGHLVQCYEAKSELENLASVPNHYLVPKDGTPLAGLIQDHVIAAVKLTMRDRFLDYSDYLDLIYHALRPLFDAARQSMSEPPLLITLKPAIYWPKRLWTGKQVISTLLMNLTPEGLPHLNANLLGRRAKAELWSGGSSTDVIQLSDVDLIVCDGYLVSGMLDKSHIGSSSQGLVHCVHEAYGSHTAAHLLNGISLLANRFLNYTAFTMGLSDILLSERANKERTRRFDTIKELGLCAFADVFKMKLDDISEASVQQLYRQAQFAKDKNQGSKNLLAQLDMAIKDRLKRAQDAVCDSAIPSGLYVKFPENNLQLMVHVGAKGGMVNAQQMSVALGQIELEGRRVPLMLSGKTLPSFPAYDVRPRAGGMCTARFLTSLPPQELFFHSMAGRDGLVDTAVKTSRSGYLQRSAIKHLEDLSIRYDGTVRDSGQNVIQFRYGEDGVDVCQAAFLNSIGMNFFADNANLFMKRWRTDEMNADPVICERMFQTNPLPKPLQLIADEVGVKRQKIINKVETEHKIRKIFRRSKKAEDMLERCKIEDSDSNYSAPCDQAKDLRYLSNVKIIHSQAPPGEPVGLLAAQSVGEPSTQMTLNTFHFAGRGEMNVTLGIPRLREILMTGSAQISTPCIEVPIHSTPEAQKLSKLIAKRFYKLKLSETLRLPIGEKVDYMSDSCTLEFNLEPKSAYSDRSYVTPIRVIYFMERVLFPDLARRLDDELKDQGKTSLIKSYALSALARENEVKSNTNENESESANKSRSGAKIKSEEVMDESRNDLDDDDGDATGVHLDRAMGLTRNRARDEWNEDDGYEAIRRRKLEVEIEDEDDLEDVYESAKMGALAGRSNHDLADSVIDLDELVDLDNEDDSAGKNRQSWKRAQQQKHLQNRNNEDVDDEDAELDEIGQVADLGSSSDQSDQEDQMNEKNLGKLQSTEKELDGLNLLETVAPDSIRSASEYRNRVHFVTSLHARFSKYDYDRENVPPRWARLTICMFDPKEGRILIDLKTLVMRMVNSSAVSSVPGIEKAIIDRTNPTDWVFRIEGLNVNEILRYPNVFNLNRLYTNSIALMHQTYGIEAAHATIKKEVSAVFGHYGINVNPRHLSLISDYMTKNGLYQAFNRHALMTHPSPLQQMSFETVTNALRSSIQEDRTDNLISPSASLVTGRLVHFAGTNCFELYQKLSCS